MVKGFRQRVVSTLVALSLGSAGWAQGLGAPVNKSLGRVLLVGDSITLGAGSSGGYRSLLESKLERDGYTFEFVGSSTENSSGMDQPRHEGHGGWSTRDVLFGRANEPSKGNISTWLRSTSPDIVLLMTGTNDNCWVPRQDWAADFSRLYRAIYAFRPDIKIVVAAIPKSDNTVTGKRDGEYLAFSVLRSITGWFQRKGHKMSFADPFTAFNPQTDLADAYHPNVYGYNKIADAFYGAIKKVMQ